MGAALGTSSSWLSCATSSSASGNGSARPTPKSLLILGGTGFLGPQLVEAARGRGHRLTLFNRGKTRPELFAGAANIEMLQGDRDGKLGALEGRKWDAVIDTSGYFPRVVKMSAELLAPNVRQYVFISTISVYADLSADVSKAGIDESARLARIDDPTIEKVTPQSYGALKALCEQAAEASLPGRATILRPGLIVGPEDPTDRFTYWPARIDRGGEVLAPGDGIDPIQFIDARDLAAWTIELIDRGVTGTFNALGPSGVFPVKDLLAACVSVNPGKATLTWIPTAFLEQQKVSPWSDMPVWIPRGDSPPTAVPVRNDRALGQGLKFRPVEVTVRDTLAWWKSLPAPAPAGEKEHPFKRTARLRAGISPEREAEVLTTWRASAGASKP
ncbi:MAG TPA: NAD-dependent epimerase/dehydratase family protein [Myxococcaceae bacterium]|nr:NAD-dependent epimerase/dehydratase family protein [Myxococcaceae bacterium]